MHNSRQGQAARKRWLPVAIIGLIAVTAGVAVPQTLPTASEPAPSKTTTDSKPPGDLAYAPATLPEAPDAKGMMTRLGLATAGVLVLCVVSLWGARRWLNPISVPPAAAKHLRLAETLLLGNRCALHLVEVGHHKVLVAADPSGLKSIVPLQDSFDSEMLATANSNETPSNLHATYQRAVATDAG